MGLKEFITGCRETQDHFFDRSYWSDRVTVFTNSDKIIMEKIITIEDARAIVERLPKTLEKRKVLPKNICPADEHIIKVVEENFANGETDKIWHHNSVTG